MNHLHIHLNPGLDPDTLRDLLAVVRQELGPPRRAVTTWRGVEVEATSPPLRAKHLRRAATAVRKFDRPNHTPKE